MFIAVDLANARLLVLRKLLLHLVCLSYSLYLIWLLAYLTWPVHYGNEDFSWNLGCIAPSLGVILNLMIYFTKRITAASRTNSFLCMEALFSEFTAWTFSYRERKAGSLVRL